MTNPFLKELEDLTADEAKKVLPDLLLATIVCSLMSQGIDVEHATGLAPILLKRARKIVAAADDLIPPGSLMFGRRRIKGN